MCHCDVIIRSSSSIPSHLNATPAITLWPLNLTFLLWPETWAAAKARKFRNLLPSVSPSALFPLRFLSQHSCTFLIPSICTFYGHLCLFDLITNIVLAEVKRLATFICLLGLPKFLVKCHSVAHSYCETGFQSPGCRTVHFRISATGNSAYSRLPFFFEWNVDSNITGTLSYTLNGIVGPFQCNRFSHLSGLHNTVPNGTD